MNKFDTVGWEDGAKQVELQTSLIESVTRGIENILASALVGGWTAFEVLASDLWTETVNQFPILGVRALKADPLETDNDATREKKEKTKVEIVAQRLLDPEFDLRREMGDVLSESFPMIKFFQIVDAYKSIFRDNALCDIIRHRDIRTLSAVRNAFVHNAGNADDDFRGKVKNDPRFSNLKFGDRIELSGAVTVELLKSVLRQGIAILNYVGKWCAAQQKKTAPVNVICASIAASTTAVESSVTQGK